MFRKGMNERSQSAGTKLIVSKKLPSDFFTPSQSALKKQSNSQSQVNVRQIKSIEKIKQKDDMLFTFNQNDHLSNYAPCA